jgi:hypothetical protein
VTRYISSGALVPSSNTVSVRFGSDALTSEKDAAEAGSVPR